MRSQPGPTFNDINSLCSVIFLNLYLIKIIIYNIIYNYLHNDIQSFQYYYNMYILLIQFYKYLDCKDLGGKDLKREFVINEY